jgi:hypothetical protein
MVNESIKKIMFMKRNFFLLLVLSLSVLISCNKESKDSAVETSNQESSMTLLKSATTTSQTNQAAFTIKSAGFVGEYLYLALSYQGKTKPHQFNVVWDGMLKTEDEKTVIELSVSHLTNDDPGTTMVNDSLIARFSSLNIDQAELENPNLWIRVINTTDASNTLFFKYQSSSTTVSTPAAGSPGYPITGVEMKVFKAECDNVGMWGDLWLSSDNNGIVNYYVVGDKDASVDYIPKENDRLLIDFEYFYPKDTIKIDACHQFYNLDARTLKITKLQAIN